MSTDVLFATYFVQISECLSSLFISYEMGTIEMLSRGLTGVKLVLYDRGHGKGA